MNLATRIASASLLLGLALTPLTSGTYVWGICNRDCEDLALP